MRKFVSIVAIIISLTTSNNCVADVFDEMRGGFTEKSDCGILYKVGRWTSSETLDGREFWGRRRSWFGKDGWIDESGDSFDFDPKSEKSYNIINNPKSAAAITYIGPWMKVNLSSGFLWNRQTKQVEIRMIATQNGKYIENHYESKDDLNKDIPEQRFILLESTNLLLPVCEIRWVSKFGYNAVADYHVNIFRAYLGKSILGGSGKIIDSETGKVIADKDGKLVEEKE